MSRDVVHNEDSGSELASDPENTNRLSDANDVGYVFSADTVAMKGHQSRKSTSNYCFPLLQSSNRQLKFTLSIQRTQMPVEAVNLLIFNCAEFEVCN